MRRIVVVVLVLLLSPIVVFAGGQSQDDAEMMEEEQIVLEFLGYDGAPGRLIEAVIPIFEAETGIQVNYTQMFTTDIVAKAMADTVAGSSSFDGWISHPAHINTLAAAGAFYPLTDYIDEFDVDVDDIFDGFMTNISYEGTIYTLPFRGFAYNMIYRTDVLQQAGLSTPETLTELLEVARELHDPPEMNGVVLMGAGSPLYQTWMQMLWAFGGDLHDGSYYPTLNSEAAINATEYLIELKEYMPDGFLGLTDDDVLTYMQQGRAAITIMGFPYFALINDSDQSTVAGSVAVAPVPGEVDQKVFGAVSGIGINPHSENKEAMFRFARFVMENEAQKVMVPMGNLAPLHSFYNDPEVERDMPQVVPYEEVLSNSYWPETPPEWSEVQTVITDFLAEAINGDRPVREAHNRIQEEAIRILTEAGHI